MAKPLNIGQNLDCWSDLGCLVERVFRSLVKIWIIGSNVGLWVKCWVVDQSVGLRVKLGVIGQLFGLWPSVDAKVEAKVRVMVHRGGIG